MCSLTPALLDPCDHGFVSGDEMSYMWTTMKGCGRGGAGGAMLLPSSLTHPLQKLLQRKTRQVQWGTRFKSPREHTSGTALTSGPLLSQNGYRIGYSIGATRRDKPICPLSCILLKTLLNRVLDCNLKGLRIRKANAYLPPRVQTASGNSGVM